jgi:adenylate cyclase
LPSLLVTEGPIAGRRIPLDHTVVLGRANADVTIEDPLISRRHAVVRNRPPVVEIEDLGSLNGTWVNGERITKARSLHSGDVIRLGNTHAQVEADAEAARATVRAPSPVADVRALPFAPPGGDSLHGREDELRTATVLFADLAGSTGVGEQLAPYDVKTVIGECVTRMSRAIERFGGSVQAYMGDGVAAFFGVPIAHEDAPERAARAGLAILDAVHSYSAEVEETWGIPPLSARVGINTGEVAVGLVGAAEPQAVSVGDTTNVAARLEGAAEPGTIYVGEATASSLLHRFSVEPLGELRVKGRNRPVNTWRLVGVLQDERTYSTPFVGRAEELDRLRGVLDDLEAGRGQVVFLVGESGIGKTRLLGEARALAGDRVMWLEGHCLSYGTEVLYGPLIEALRGWFGSGERDGARLDTAQTRAKLGLVPELDEEFAAPYLGRLLGIRLEPEAEKRLAELTPDELGAGLRRAYRAWLGSLAERLPVVLALEDLHWADESTRQLAGELLDLTELAPLLVVGTLRPDTATEGWQLRARVQAELPHRLSELTLGPLDGETARALLEAHPAAREVQPSVLDEVQTEAEGNPLYMEELLNAIATGRRQPRRRTWRPTVAIPTLTPTLESVLLSRIDRLPAEARGLAQTAAVVGRRFPLRVLETLAGRDLSHELAALVHADIVREIQRSPEAQYEFRHGLLCETALMTLPPTRRRELYGAVGTAFETLWAPVPDDRLEVLAHYFALSNDLGRGLRYLERAAERATALDAGPHAAELRRRALLVAERLGDADASRRLRAGLED